MMTGTGLKRRAARALERQREYQEEKARALQGHEDEMMADMADRSAKVRARLDSVRPIPKCPRVLEVGSGAHGLIFFFEAGERVGIDPLADEYRNLFPKWQGKAETIAAFGEHLPFEDSTFDIVLSDNVVDHAEDPRRIIEEIARVMRPGALLYFAVNIHHPIYHWAARVHSTWQAAGIPFEITPFADHTVHLTFEAARQLFARLPLRILNEFDTISETQREGRSLKARHAGDWLKRWFFKNARWEVIAVKEG